MDEKKCKRFSDSKQGVSFNEVRLLFQPWVCSGKKSTWRSEINISLPLWSFTDSNNETIPCFPVKTVLCCHPELCLAGDWQQLCHCWATNQIKFLGLWSLDNSWITRAVSQKRHAYFCRPAQSNGCVFETNCPGLCFTGMCLHLPWQ